MLGHGRCGRGLEPKKTAAQKLENHPSKTKILTNLKTNKLREIEFGEMHVEILPPVGKVKCMGQMIPFVDQETTDVLGPRSPKSTRTVIPIISISAPTAPVRRSGHTDNCIRSPEMGHNKRTRKMHTAPFSAECSDSSYKQKVNTKNKMELEVRHWRRRNQRRKLKKKLAQIMNATTVAFLSTTMKKAQQAMKTILKTGLNTLKEAREKLIKKC